MIIDPVVKVTNQKKPKALMRAVWEQLVLEQKDAEWAAPFFAAAFDGRKNAYSPIPFPLRQGTSQLLYADGLPVFELMSTDEAGSFTVAVNADGVVQRPGHSSSSDDEQRRWRVSIREVAQIDLEAVIKFCTPSAGVMKVEEACLTGESQCLLVSQMYHLSQMEELDGRC